MKISDMRKELQKVLVAIDKLDAKCKDVRLSLVYNFILQIYEDGKVDMDYYNEEMEKEREFDE